jgi:hypothetical protein
VAGCQLSKLLNPLIKGAKGQFLLIFLGDKAIINHNRAEVAPFWNKLGKLIFLPDFLLLMVDMKLDFAN